MSLWMDRISWPSRVYMAVAIAVLVALVPVRTSRSTEASAPTAAATAKLDGVWQGILQGQLRLVLHVTGRPEGGLSAKLDSPDQGALGLEIDWITFEQGELRFEMQRIGASFAGKTSETGTRIVGEWKQGGMTLPLTLERSEKVSEVRRPQVPEKPYPYEEEQVSFPNRRDGITLAGTFTRPSGKGPFPAVLLITGSGPEDRDETVFGHRPFLILADHLTRKGIAVLRVDDRGVGKSTGRFAGATSEDFAEDALAGVEYLKTRREVHPREIGLVGHSEGGIIAPLAAKRTGDVAYLVLLAAPGLPGDELLVLQGGAIRRTMGVGEAEIARIGEIQKRLFATLKQERDSAVAAEKLRPIMAELVAAEPSAPRDTASLKSLVQAQLAGLLSPWLRFFVAYDPRPVLAALAIPMLALNGERDVQVPPKENLGAIDEALRTGGNRHYRVKTMSGLNHLFQTSTTGSVAEYARIEETMAPAALDEIAGWIRKQTLQRR